MNNAQVDNYGEIEFPIDPVDRDEAVEEEEFSQTEAGEVLNRADVPQQLIEFEREDVVLAMEPSARIERLFENMFSKKRVLLALLSLCKQQGSYAQACELVGTYDQSSHSVYAVDSFLNMLVKAGALERVTESGDPYEAVPIEPVEVEVDGSTFLEVSQAPEVFWRTTPAGAEALAANDSVVELGALFTDHETLKPAFAAMLELCSNDTGASIQTLRDAINGRPDVVGENKSAQFLLDYLSQAGAVYFDVGCRGWKATETGALALQLLQESEG